MTKLVDDAWNRSLPATEYFRLGRGTVTVLTQREPGAAVVRSAQTAALHHSTTLVRSLKTIKKRR